MIAFLIQNAAPSDSLPAIGVSGLAGIIFWFYRADRKDSEEKHQACERMLMKFGDEFRVIVQDNTKAMQSLVDAVDDMKRPK